MKQMTGKFLESCRATTGYGASDKSYGFNGVFRIRLGDATFMVVCSDGADWDHVSVSLPTRLPTWDEMCAIKDLFFDEHERVMQLHPPKPEYVNNHSHCLHLWRPQAQAIPQPPGWMVGIKDLGVLV